MLNYGHKNKDRPRDLNRVNLFNEFIGMPTSIYDMTVHIDVMKLVNYCRTRQESFFINYLHLALRELNGIPEFRMRGITACPTTASRPPYFLNRSMTDANYETFYSEVSHIITKAKTEKNTHPENSDLDRTDLLYFSALLWVQSMTLPVTTNPHGTSNRTCNAVLGIG